MGKIKISAIVLIGGNYDKELLKKCLKSLEWTDEIVKVESENIQGSFSEWRNYGAKKALGEWLFYVDADEEVTPKLREEVRRQILEGKYPAYAIPRTNILLGKRMRFGGWSPDYVLRLIRKEVLVKWEGKLHEQPVIKGEIGKLKQPLIHRSHRSLTEMVEKTNAWSEIEADLLYKSGHPKMNIFRFCSAGFREFWHRGIVKLGFLDGTVGVIEVIYQVFSRLITYSKLWEKQLKKETI